MAKTRAEAGERTLLAYLRHAFCHLPYHLQMLKRQKPIGCSYAKAAETRGENHGFKRKTEEKGEKIWWKRKKFVTLQPLT